MGYNSVLLESWLLGLAASLVGTQLVAVTVSFAHKPRHYQQCKSLGQQHLPGVSKHGQPPGACSVHPDPLLQSQQVQVRVVEQQWSETQSHASPIDTLHPCTHTQHTADTRAVPQILCRAPVGLTECRTHKTHDSQSQTFTTAPWHKRL